MDKTVWKIDDSPFDLPEPPQEPFGMGAPDLTLNYSSSRPELIGVYFPGIQHDCRIAVANHRFFGEFGGLIIRNRILNIQCS